MNFTLPAFDFETAKFGAINHAIRVGINQAIHRSLRMADLFRQRLLTV